MPPEPPYSSPNNLEQSATCRVSLAAGSAPSITGATYIWRVVAAHRTECRPSRPTGRPTISSNLQPVGCHSLQAVHRRSPVRHTSGGLSLRSEAALRTGHRIWNNPRSVGCHSPKAVHHWPLGTVQKLVGCRCAPSGRRPGRPTSERIAARAARRPRVIRSIQNGPQPVAGRNPEHRRARSRGRGGFSPAGQRPCKPPYASPAP